jgi:carotenoid cleavage dioxygenase-like enzyme
MTAEKMATAAGNPYLEGNFAPVREEVTAEDLKVIGELPSDLSGMFLRNGSNPQFPPIGQYHWFDGDGMLHGVRISNGKASYLNRYVRTRGFEIERDAGQAIWTGLLEPPQTDNPHGAYKNKANTALVWHAGQLLALWEGVRLMQLNCLFLILLGSGITGGSWFLRSRLILRSILGVGR